MLAADYYPDLHPDVTIQNHELLEVHRSKISLHHAKVGYDYPVIRLPYTFSKLAGLPTQIYQTVHNGALAFLIVVSSSNKSELESQEKSEGFAIRSRYSYLHGEGRVFESSRANLFL
jgi:prolipoprotein diacylglyceryltransferase